MRGQSRPTHQKRTFLPGKAQAWLFTPGDTCDRGRHGAAEPGSPAVSGDRAVTGQRAAGTATAGTHCRGSLSRPDIGHPETTSLLPRVARLRPPARLPSRQTVTREFLPFMVPTRTS